MNRPSDDGSEGAAAAADAGDAGMARPAEGLHGATPDLGARLSRRLGPRGMASLGIALVATTALLLHRPDVPTPRSGGAEPRMAASLLDGLPAGSLVLAQAGDGPMPGSGRIIAGLGVVEPRSGTIDLAPGVPGILSAVLVEEGDTVKRGQLLAALFNDDIKARVGQAEATLRIRTARRDLVVNGAREEEIRQAEARLRQAESALELADVQFARRERLVKTGAISREDFNQSANARAAAREEVNTAEEALSILLQGERPEAIEAAQAEVALAESQLAEARAAFALTEIRATVDGVVLRRYREPGEVIGSQAETPVLQIADTTVLVVRTQIDEADIGGLAVGQPAVIGAAAFAGKTFKGTVQRISPRLGAKTLTAEDPAEKRDTRVLDAIVALEPGVALPINLRVDVQIDTSVQATPPTVMKGDLSPPEAPTIDFAGAAFKPSLDHAAADGTPHDPGPETTASINRIPVDAAPQTPLAMPLALPETARPEPDQPEAARPETGLREAEEAASARTAAAHPLAEAAEPAGPVRKDGPPE